ncbi:MAG TPA: ATP-binding protein, partial [Pirellulales bacterium]
EFAKTIHSSGNDLLMLINDILDLSKIESGTVVVEVGEVRLDDLRGYVERTFRHVAEAKNVGFLIRTSPDLPRSINTDAKRLQQIIKNLLSNAFKFTSRGQVALTIEASDAGWSLDNDELNRSPSVLAFTVTDTGIGIPADKQMIIFEAFQQADGSTSRKYGGTGLGLAISRELSQLLGGEIRLVSTPGRGSTFTLYLPQTYSGRGQRKAAALASETLPTRGNGAAIVAHEERASPASTEGGDVPAGETDCEAGVERVEVNELGDDREHIQPGDRVLLIVENDLSFARVLLEAAREHGFKGLVATRGTSALALARDYMPDALTLDISLPDVEGWRVLERLKNDLATRHIPVCVASTFDAGERAFDSGGLLFVAKPIRTRGAVDAFLKRLVEFVDRVNKTVLVVASDPARAERLAAGLSGGDVEVLTAADGPGARGLLGERTVDCLVLDAADAPLAAPELTDALSDDEEISRLPAIVYNDERGAVDDAGAWLRLASGLRARRAASPERLLDLVTASLHRDVSELPDSQRRMLESLHSSDDVLAGKRVLIVDDDMR